MSRARIIEFLPDVYARFLPAFFDEPLTEERHATCHACAMCAPATGAAFPAEGYFSPDTKCCTFHPALPNYAVGGLLGDRSDAGAEGRRRIEAAIASRIGVTPIGILPPARRAVLQQHARRAFGRARSLLCPYFDASHGGCTVWAHREAECATWFCKHNDGYAGREFWNQLRDYLAGVHRLLASHVLHELGFDPDRIAAGYGRRDDLDARDLDGAPPSEADYSAMWGAWAGREAELYTTAYEMVQALDRERFAALAGLTGGLDLARLEKRYTAMRNPVLPDRLLKNPSMRVMRTPEGVAMMSYESGEPTRLRTRVFELLDYFDGRHPTADVQAAVLAETGYTITDRFLTALYQHRILVAADAAWREGARG